MGEDLSPSTKLGYAFLCVALVLFAGLMSGLTLGLLSLDRVELEVRGREAAVACAMERAAAASVWQARQRGLSGAAPRVLQVLLRSGTSEQKRQAATVIPVRRPRRAGLQRPCRGRCTRRAVAFGFDAACATQLVKKGHQLLVTLLLMNAAAMEVRRARAPGKRSACGAVATAVKGG